MTKHRETPIEISREEFKKIGYQFVDMISYFNDTIDEKPVTTGETPIKIQNILGNASLPEVGISPSEIFSRTTNLLFNHSLLNGHPKFLGYITSSPAPIGALADLLASVVNPNVGANILSPMATAIEKQTIKWLAEFIGISPDYGGILVSGDNMANFNAFLTARTAKGFKNLKEIGFSNSSHEMLVYASKATHTWIEKAAVLFGHGLNAMIKEDIELSKLLFELAKNHPELEAVTQNLSITTFRYIPFGYSPKDKKKEVFLNNLNKKLLNVLQLGGEVFLSNAIVSEKYCLRACIVNFRTSKKDIEEIIEIIVRKGREMNIRLIESQEKRIINR